MQEFDDSRDYAILSSSQTLNSQTAFANRWSEQTLAALRAAGVFDNLIDDTVAPTDTSALWLDKNTDPAVLKVFDDPNWRPATSTDFFAANLQQLLDGKADSDHTHAIDDVTNLQDVVDSKVEVYADRATAIAATVPALMLRLYVNSPSSRILVYERDASGTAISTNGGTVNWSPVDEVFADHWAENTTPGTTNMTTAIQAAIDFLSFEAGGLGGVVNLTPGDYAHSGFQLKSGVHIRGAHRAATKLVLISGSNTNSINIAPGIDVFGWSGLTIQGNLAGNTTGHGIYFEQALTGGEYTSEESRTTSATRAYKHCIAYDFAVAACAEHNIFLESRNFKVFFDNFTSLRSTQDGLRVFSSDCFFSNFYIERSGFAGLYASGSNNKYTSGKCIWSGRGNNTFAGAYITGSSNTFVSVEAQDNYCDGWSLGGPDNTYIGCTSNRNGYLGNLQEDQSSRVHADIRVRTTAVNIMAQGCKVFTYATAVGADGFWTTEWPVFFDSFAVSQIRQWDVEIVDPTRYNQAANFTMSGSDANGEYIRHNDGTMTVISTVQYDSDTSGQIAAGASQTATWTIPGSGQVPFVGTSAQATVHLTNAAGTTTTFVNAAASFSSATQRHPTTTCVWSVINNAGISRPVRVFISAQGRWR